MHSRMTFTNATPLDDALHARRQERTTLDVLIDHRAAPSLPHHPLVDFLHPRQFLRAHRRKKERKRKREGSFSTSRRITTCTRAIPLGIPDGRPIERVFTKEKPDARTSRSPRIFRVVDREKGRAREWAGCLVDGRTTGEDSSVRVRGQGDQRPREGGQCRGPRNGPITPPRRSH